MSLSTLLWGNTSNHFCAIGNGLFCMECSLCMEQKHVERRGMNTLIWMKAPTCFCDQHIMIAITRHVKADTRRISRSVCTHLLSSETLANYFGILVNPYFGRRAHRPQLRRQLHTLCKHLPGKTIHEKKLSTKKMLPRNHCQFFIYPYNFHFSVSFS